MKYLSILVMAIFLSIGVLAQDSCSAFVSDVLSTLDAVCEATSRNELCYGHDFVSITPVSSDMAFSQPGDMTSTLNIDSIHTGPFVEANEWGIALMRVQANLPDTTPDQNVTFLLFGDVYVTNVGTPDAVSLPASTTASVNIRSGPSTDHAIVGNLQSGMDVELIGRNALGDWVYFITDDISGWLYVPLLDIEGDVTALDEVPDDVAGKSPQGPMQAIYLSSGMSDTNCTSAPPDGVLIQAPADAEPVDLTINDVEIQLASTIYVQAQAGDVMTIYVLDGQIDVKAFGVTRRVPQGALTSIPIDEELKALDVPNMPVPYDVTTLTNLPVSALSQTINISQTASTVDIQGLNACRASVAETVNLRGGPGTRYSVIEAIDNDAPLNIVEQAVGTGGYVWYNLSSDAELWVRSDLVTLGDNCDSIPTANRIPPVPTSDPSGNWIPFNLFSCWGTLGRPIRAGMYIQFKYGCCGEWTVEENDTMRGGNNAWIMLDGAMMDVHFTSSRLMTEGFYIANVTATWMATPGTHTVSSGWPAANREETCTFTVEE